MEEKIDNVDEKKLYNVWRSRIVFAISFILVIIAIYFIRHEEKNVIDFINNNFETMQNLLFIIFGVLLMTVTAYILYIAIINDRYVTKVNIKNIIWKIFVILFLIATILIHIRNQLVISAQEDDIVPCCFIDLDSPEREIVNDGDDNKSELIEIDVFKAIIFATLIILLIFIKKKLNKRVYETDIDEKTKWLPYFINFMINNFICLYYIFLSTVETIGTLEQSIISEIVSFGFLIPFPLGFSLFSSNFEYNNKFDLKRCIWYVISTYAIFISIIVILNIIWN